MGSKTQSSLKAEHEMGCDLCSLKASVRHNFANYYLDTDRQKSLQKDIYIYIYIRITNRTTVIETILIIIIPIYQTNSLKLKVLYK